MSIFTNSALGLGKTINTVGSISDLKAYRPTRLCDGDTVIVTGRANTLDGNGGIYGWEETSTATPDDFEVVRPNMAIGEGRWLLIIGKQGKRGDAVANATDATDVILRLNDLLARLRTHGLIQP